MAGTSLGEAFVEVRYALDKLSGDLGQVQRTVQGQLSSIEGKTSSAFERTGGRIRKAFAGMQEPVAQLGGALAGLGAANVFNDIIKTAGEFESKLNRVKAVAQLTDDQLAGLRAQAVKLGAETSFSATEAADAMGKLADAGFSLDEIMQAVPGVIDLAAAAQTDLATAATQAGDTLRQYGVAASDIGRVNDVLAKTSIDSTAGITDLGFSLKYLGPNARAAGVSLEQSAAALGVLANAGIRGEQAGTSMRSIISTLQEMENPPKRLREAMERLGIEFSDVDLRSKSLGDIIAFLSTKLTSGGDALALFGTEASSAANILVQNGGAVNQFAANLSNVEGVAKRVGDTNMAGFKGALDELGGAFESLKLSIANSGLLEGVTALIKAVGDIVAKISEADPALLKLGGAFVGLVALIAPVTAAIGLFVLAAGTIGGPVLLAAGALTALGAAAFAFSDQIASGFTKAQEYLASLVAAWGAPGTGLGAIVEVTRQAATNIIGVIQSTLAGLPEIGRQIADGFKNGFVEGIATLIGSVLGAIAKFHLDIVAAITRAVVAAVQAWFQGIQGADWSGGITAALPTIVNALGGFVKAASEAALRFVVAFVSAVAASFGADLGAVFGTSIDEAKAKLNAALDGLVGSAIAKLEKLKAAIRGMADELKKAGDRVKSFASGQASEIKQLLTDPTAALSKAAGDIKKSWAEMTGGIEQETQKLNYPSLAISNFTSKAAGDFQQLEKEVTGQSYYPDMVNAIGSETARLQGNMAQPLTAMLGQVSGDFERFGQTATESVASAGRAAANINTSLAQTKEEQGPRRRGLGGRFTSSDTGAAGQQDAEYRRQRIADIKAEITELQRLNAAQGISVEEYRRVAAQIEGERAAREAGLSVKSAEGRAIADLTIEQNKLQETLERTEQIQGLEAEVSGLERLNVATQQGAAASERMQSTLAAEQAVRAAGLTLQDAQGQKIYDLTLKQDALTEAIERSTQITDAEQEASDAERLAIAATQGAEAHEKMRQAILAEHAARELGATATEAEIDRYVRAKQAAEDFAASEARTQRIEALQIEVSELERLDAAQRQGIAAYDATVLAIEEERAVRELGIGATREEIEVIKELIARKKELEEQEKRERNEFGAGATAALQDYVESSQEYGRIAGEAIGGGLRAAETELASFLKSGEYTFENLGKAAERFGERMIDILIDILAQQMIAGMVGMFIGGPAMGPGMGAAAPIRTRAKGGIESGPGISAFSGTIVRSPTLFPLAKGMGLMGEAGPEAILPLKRGVGGRLGVEVAANDHAANDSGPRVTVQVIDQRQGGAKIEQQRSRGADGTETIRLLVRDEVKRTVAGGDLDRQMADRYAVRPAVQR